MDAVENNVSTKLSIDETALSNGELYTIVTNKEAKGRKGTIVAMIKGTVAEDIIRVLRKIPERSRNRVQEVTMDMAANMQLAIKRCFINAHWVIDRFHVQKLAYDAVQECRIKYLLIRKVFFHLEKNFKLSCLQISCGPAKSPEPYLIQAQQILTLLGTSSEGNHVTLYKKS